jgi:PhzF family phenazine biosynthesis protein
MPRMNIPIYQVDAFSSKLFSGNPAAVCVLPTWFSDNLLQKIASENNQPATAFLVKENEEYHMRWFTPEYEIDLCGHGTLSAAHVIFQLLEPHKNQIDFITPAGPLYAYRQAERITLDFPVKKIEECAAPTALIEGLGMTPTKVYQYKAERYLVVYDTEDDIKKLRPDMRMLQRLPHRGVIVTAQGDTVDFVSRVFYPKKTLYEDAMTGSSYCLLVPYWVQQLQKQKFHALQLSQRGGEVICESHENKVLLHGHAVIYMQGMMTINVTETIQ